jgi:malyl-CoA/(S)-citramalyl-CoA lyase
MTKRLQRCALAVPATSTHFFEKAARGAADSIFLDLEDAIAPARKAQARTEAIRALNEIDWGLKLLSVRVNGLDTAWALEDIVDVARNCPRLDLILLPKTSTAFDVKFVDQILTLIERETKRDKKIGIEVLIETAQGVANVEDIACSSSRLEAMVFGVGDYTVEMQTQDIVFGRPNSDYFVLSEKNQQGQRHPHVNDQWHFAMARIANACRANGLRPIDGPFTDFSDGEGFLSSAWRAKSLGFEGKWAIHPTQIDSANAVFSPSQSELDWAVRIVNLLEEVNSQGRGAVAENGVLIDMAHLKKANLILNRQGLIDTQKTN